MCPTHIQSVGQTQTTLRKYVGLYKWQAISVHKVEVMQTKIRQYESYAVQCIQNYVLSAICQSGFTRATSFAF